MTGQTAVIPRPELGAVSYAALGSAVMPEGWVPSYEPWRHGGWYVTNVRYPSGAVGCVSRNYTDRKWRVVCRNTGPGAEGDQTYPNRDFAARAELGIAADEAYRAGVFDTSRLWLGRRTPCNSAQRASALAGIMQANEEWQAGQLTTSDDMIRLGWDEYQRSGYQLRWNECAITLPEMFAKRANGPAFQRVGQEELDELWAEIRAGGEIQNGITHRKLTARYGDRLYHVAGDGWYLRPVRTYRVTPNSDGPAFEVEAIDVIAAMREASERVGSDAYVIKRTDATPVPLFGSLAADGRVQL